MHPPAKRMRMWRPDHAASKDDEPSVEPIAQQGQDKLATPTRTINLSDFQRRAYHMEMSPDEMARLKARGQGIYMMPRAPLATVTATVVEVSVMDGTIAASKTQIVAQTSDVVLTLGGLGTLTVPAFEPTTASSTSLISGITSLPSLPPIITSATSITSPLVNTTALVSSGELVATVTSTSVLAVSLNNGTIVVPLRTSSRSRTSSSTTTTEASDSETTSSLSESASSSLADVSVAATSPGLTTSTGATATPPIAAAPTTAAAPPTNDGGGVTLTPQQQQVVGGVVGSVAGVALVVVALLYFLKWYRQRMQSRHVLPDEFASSSREIHNSGGEPDALSDRQHQPMTQMSRDSIGPIAVVANRLKRLRPFSANTTASSSTIANSLAPAESERSFERVAGRKIPPALSTGGDGYGGNYGVFDQRASTSSPLRRPFSEASVYSDSIPHEGMAAASLAHHRQRSASISEPGSPTNPFLDPPTVSNRGQTRSPPVGTNTRDFATSRQNTRPPNFAGFSPAATMADGYATLRPSPARTPVTQSPTGSYVHIPQPVSTPPLLHGDIPDLPTLPALNSPSKGPRNYSRPHNAQSPPRSFSAANTRSASSMSGVSNGNFSGRVSSVGGRFKEDID